MLVVQSLIPGFLARGGGLTYILGSDASTRPSIKMKSPNIQA